MDEVKRPWGGYCSLEKKDNYQVKRIFVEAGQAISLQLHHHRAEHWIVVSGRARVTRDDDVLELGVGDTIYLPVKCKHRLENCHAERLEVIEVQIGDYLEEDDIVRFDDKYGRMNQGGSQL